MDFKVAKFSKHDVKYTFTLEGHGSRLALKAGTKQDSPCI